MKKLLLFSVIIFFSPLIASTHIGQRFIFSLPRTNSAKELKHWLEKTKPAGVMLEAGNFKDRQETKKLCSQLQDLAKKLKLPKLFICVDWEGGIVSRPNEEGGFVSVPSPYALARAGRSSSFLAGKLIGQQLRDIGANVDFAPSFDLFDPHNYILATRCFSDNPEKVAVYALAFSQGLLSEGILPVAKHFPGLGLGNHDTHLASVTISFDQKTFAVHSEPFKKALLADIPCIMASHAQCEQFGAVPITHSKHAARYLQSLNPTTLLITDDFSMKAGLNNMAQEDAIFAGLCAGYHLLIFSGTIRDQENLVAHLQDKVATLSDLEQEEFEKCAQDIQAFKDDRLKPITVDQVLDEEKTAKLLAQRCVTSPGINIGPSSILFSVNVPKLRPADTWYVQNNRTYLGEQLKNSCRRTPLLVLKQASIGANGLLSDQDTSIIEIILDAKDTTSIDILNKHINKSSPETRFILQTFFYGKGTWNDIQENWLRALKPYQDRVTIFSLGHPYEKTILPQATIIELGSFHKPLINQAVQHIAQKHLVTGADKLMQNPKKYLSNKRFGLVCHQCSTVTLNNKHEFLPDILYTWAQKQKNEARLLHSAEALAKANKTKLAALFSPEHGLSGNKEAFAYIDSENDSAWQCPVYSLHGKHRSPTADMLKNLDLVIIDLQEVGVRCFTYLSTMVLVLEEAAKNNIPVLVLDRPNPLYHLAASGPELEKEHESFLGKINTPFVHGKTMSKLAHQVNKTLNADLSALECEGDHQAHATYFQTQKASPSPNLASIEAIRAYPMTVFIEGTNYSEGRGTAHPFEQIGAPWIDKNELASQLNNKNFAGVYFEPVSFIPQKIAGKAENPKHNNALCHGIFVHITDPANTDPTKIGYAILDVLFDLYPQQSVFLKYGNRYALDLLAGTSSWREKIG